MRGALSFSSFLLCYLSQVDSSWLIPSYFFRQACVSRTLSGAREVDALLEQTVDCCCQKHMHIYILLHGLYIYFSRIFRTQCGHNLGWMHNGDHMMNHKWKLLVEKKYMAMVIPACVLRSCLDDIVNVPESSSYFPSWYKLSVKDTDSEKYILILVKLHSCNIRVGNRATYLLFLERNKIINMPIVCSLKSAYNIDYGFQIILSVKSIFQE